jgi:serine phosphatase RsbU (regulator of sigma subunit)
MLDELSDELKNFEEIARYLNPSSGEIPRLPNLEIAGLSLPLRSLIGGDHTIYIDFSQRYDLDARIAEASAAGSHEVARKLESMRQRAGILLADVSGHRMTDAAIAAMLHQAFLTGAYYELELYGEITTRLFEHINNRFFKTNSINKYFTMVYGEISTQGKFRFISAGHQPPAVFSREFGRFVAIGADRMVSVPPVGLLPTHEDREATRQAGRLAFKRRYPVNEISLLSPGDMLLLFTDGLAEHGDGAFFPERVERLLADHAHEPAAAICEHLKQELLAFAPPRDDISAVLIQYRHRNG